MTTQILIVDDDTNLADSLRDEVVRMGFGARVCDSADAALEVVLNSKVDVLLTDLRMAGRDGIELIKLVRQTSPETRTLLMSAFATAKDYKVATEHGALDVLTKPFTPEDLAEALRKAEDSQTGVQGTVHGLDLTDILQMFHLSKRSLIVKVGADGAIHLREGEIVHAVAGEQEGEEALLTLLSARSASVRTAAAAPAVERTIEARFDQLLMDAMRQLDESRRDEELVADSFSDQTPATLVDPPKEAHRPDGVAPEPAPEEIEDEAKAGAEEEADVAASGRRKRLPSAPYAPVQREPARRSPAIWIVLLAAVAAAVFGLVCWLGGDKDPTPGSASGSGAIASGERDAASKPARQPDARAVAQPAPKPAPKATDRTVIVTTAPAGLELVDADSKAFVGKSPLTLRFAADAKARQLRARRATYLSNAIEVGPDVGKLHVDLSAWIQQVKVLQRRSGRKGQRKPPKVPAAAKPDPPKPDPPKPDPPKVAKPDPPKPAKPKLGTVGDSKPKLGTVGGDKPKIGTIGDDKPKIGTVGDGKKPKLRTID